MIHGDNILLRVKNEKFVLYKKENLKKVIVDYCYYDYALKNAQMKKLEIPVCAIEEINILDKHTRTYAYDGDDITCNKIIINFDIDYLSEETLEIFTADKLEFETLDIYFSDEHNEMYCVEGWNVNFAFNGVKPKVSITAVEY